MSYPTDLAGRQAKRDGIRARLLASAEYNAQRVSRSLVCSTGTRHDSCVGAEGCLCPCHDPKEDA